jgi:hypothetical protein
VFVFANWMTSGSTVACSHSSSLKATAKSSVLGLIDAHVKCQAIGLCFRSLNASWTRLIP